MINEVSSIIEYVKSTELKGNVEIVSDNCFMWDIGGIFLHFSIDDRETIIEYSKIKNRISYIGHFHEDNCNVINLIQDINNENKRVHICTFLGSNFCVEDKLKKKKKNFLFIRHYYSEL